MPINNTNRTIFITSFHPHISRNILFTPVLDLLKQKKDLKIVIVVPDYKVDYFKKNFCADNVFIEGIKLFQASYTKRGLLFKRLGVMIFNTKSTRAFKKYEYYCAGKYFYYILSCITGFMGRFELIRQFVRWLDLSFSPRDFFKHILDKYQPDAVFSADIQNENDVSLMQDARRRKIPIIGMLRSWDNVTMRINRIFPDRMIVGSRYLEKEMEEMYSYPSKKLVVTGHPHHDNYVKGPFSTKEEFCKKFGLNPNRKFVLYAPFSDTLVRHNDVDRYVMEALGNIDAEILVRFPPEKPVSLGDFKPPSNMKYHRPGISFGDKIGDREISRDDDNLLINSLYHADVVVSGPTSIPFDAMLMNRPAIMLEIYTRPHNFCDSILNFSRLHIIKILRMGGIRHVRTREEMLDAIDEYLKNPVKDAGERARTKSLYFSHADGHASDRLAEEIIGFVNK